MARSDGMRSFGHTTCGCLKLCYSLTSRPTRVRIHEQRLSLGEDLCGELP